MVIFLCDYGGQVPNMLQAQLKKENEMSRKKKCTHKKKVYKISRLESKYVSCTHTEKICLQSAPVSFTA